MTYNITFLDINDIENQLYINIAKYDIRFFIYNYHIVKKININSPYIIFYKEFFNNCADNFIRHKAEQNGQNLKQQ